MEPIEARHIPRGLTRHMHTLPRRRIQRPFLLALAATLVIHFAHAAADTPPRLKRADAFLGVHFDFHAGPDCTEIGKNTTPQMVQNIIDLVHPDYLQIDCKGHRGLSSYPTRVGNPAPGFVGDPLRTWRDVTARSGVSLYMHYSGVWDSEAIIQHPSWAARNAHGSTNKNATSLFGPYVDVLLVPQLRELAGLYHVDGAWIDGECWASVPDYTRAARNGFRFETGIAEAPLRPSDPHWFEFLEFNRDAFRRYLRYYIGAVHQTNPDFELCSNWAFTDHMPEPVTVPVDFLSGDYSPENSVNSARLSARYLARQGKPWDLMAWSFTLRPGANGSREKTAVQIEREAAVVLAQGGGFQAYFRQKRDGSIYSERMPVMAEVAKFCRARQAICHHAEAVPQVALLLSTPGHYRHEGGLFSREYSRLNGALQALLESQYSVEVLGEHHLAGRMQDYPLIVVPEWDYLDPVFRGDLAAYVKDGGNVLLIGPRTAAMFQKELAVTLEGRPDTEPRSLLYRDRTGPIKGETQRAKLGRGARAFGTIRGTNAATASYPAASVARLGRGNIAATYCALGQGYPADRSGVTRDFLRDLVAELFPHPLVEVKGSHDVDLSVAINHGQLLVNFVNTAGPHVTEPILESIPPIGSLEVSLRLPGKPARMRLEPDGTDLPFTYGKEGARVVVPAVAIHSVLVVEGAGNGAKP